MTIVLKDMTELVKAMYGGGALYGYKPADEVDATTWEFPVTIKVDKKAKTFVKVDAVEEKKEEVVTPSVSTQSSGSKSNKKAKIIKYAVIGLIAVVVIGIVVYVAVA